MNNFKIEFDFSNKIFDVNGQFYRFDYGRLTISDNGATIETSYEIIFKKGRYILKTGVEIFQGLKEVPIDLILNNILILKND